MTDGVRARALGLVVVVCLAFGAAIVRVRTALADPHFDPSHVQGLLKSDPALVHYVCERIAENGGFAPDDLRRDARVEWPEGADLATLTAVGQEYLVAWVWLALGRGPPLVVVALWVAAITASSTLVGVYLLALELAADVRIALAATIFSALLPASWRTVGFVFVNEDLSVPLFVLHLGLLARALRVQTAMSIALAALALGASLSTWHAASFFAAAEAACALACFAITRKNPFSSRGAWIFALIVGLFGAFVPVLRATAFLGSFGFAAIVALCAAAAWRARFGARFERWVALGALGAWLVTARLVARDAAGEHAHVFELVLAKLAHFGVRPSDPSELSFDARLMWQGPFETLRAGDAATLLGCASFAIVAAAILVASRTAPILERATAAFALVSVALAWLAVRAVFLPALLLPAITAVCAARVRRGRLLLTALIAVQAIAFVTWIGAYENPWYRFAGRNAEIAAMIDAVRAHVPAGEAIATDFMNGPAILVHTRHPILVQPKWESGTSRARVRDFYQHVFERSPQELHERLTSRYRTRWLLVDRFTLAWLSSYAAGFARAPAVPRPGTAAALLLSQDESVLRAIPGYRLVWRSSPAIVQANGEPTDFFRLYELSP